jgi:hypothetical protein
MQPQGQTLYYHYKVKKLKLYVFKTNGVSDGGAMGDGSYGL